MATTSSSSIPGPSGSKTKKRKPTKMKRAEKTATTKFIALQKESAARFEEKRMKWEIEQQNEEMEREDKFMAWEGSSTLC